MITLAQMAIRSQNPLQKGVIQLYGENSTILAGLPFIDILGNAYTAKREKTLSGIGSRAINTEYTATVSEQERISEDLKMFGGRAIIDRFAIQTSASEVDLVADEIASKVKAAAMFFNKTFIKGNAITDPNSFDGLERRVTPEQTLYAGTGAGGGVLTLDKVDELIDKVGSPNCLIMNGTMRRALNKAARASNQAVETISNSFGVRLDTYANIPICVVGVDNTFSEIMPFNEVDAELDPASCTSIYAVRYGTDGLIGLQSCPPIVDDQGMIGNMRQIVFDWYVNFVINQPKAVARLAAIKA